MPYRLAADAVVLFHGAWLVFTVLGALLALRWRRVLWVHAPVVAWGAWVEFTGTVCPLTPWENRLRQLGGEAGYQGGFIDHYVAAVLYPAGLTREIQVGLGIALLVFNAVLYGWVLRRAARGSAARG